MDRSVHQSLYGKLDQLELQPNSDAGSYRLEHSQSHGHAFDNGQRKPRSQFRLPIQPPDDISALKFVPDNGEVAEYVAMSCWDGTLMMVNATTTSEVVMHFKNAGKEPGLPSVPILCITLRDKDSVFLGDADGRVRTVDVATETVNSFGDECHTNGASCIGFSRATHQVVSGSWDSYIKTFDPRTATCTGRYLQLEQVFQMVVSDELIVSSLAENHVAIWDLRNMLKPLSERTSHLDIYNPRSLALSQDKKYYALGSCEGRVSIERVNKSRRPPFIFRAHRATNGDVYPVNAICFQPGTNRFTTGGSDKMLHLWNFPERTRECSYSAYPAGISALDFSSDGHLLVVGCSYNQDLVLAPENAGKRGSRKVYLRDMNCQYPSLPATPI